jgi:hypothetical protein
MKYLLLSLLLGLTACGSSGSNPVTPFIPFYVYGDSIDKGGGIGDSYADIISLAFNWYEINYAIGGTELTDKNQYPSIIYDCCSAFRWTPGSFVFIKPGVNDAGINGTDPTYEATYLADLITILQDVEVYTPGVTLFLGTPTEHCNTTVLGDNTTVDIYAQLNRQAFQTVGAPNVRLIEFTKTFIPTTDNTIDCLHPNVTGYTQMAQIFYQQRGN